MTKRTIQRISTILKHVETIENDLCGKTLQQFKESDVLVRATAFSLAQIGEQMNKIEEALKDKNSELPWKEARNMRNVIIHVYNEVKAEVVYETATSDLKTLKEKLIAIKRDLESSLG